MRILITGCAGYVGSVLASDLLARGYQVTGVDNLLHGGASLPGLLGHPAFTFCRGDLRDPGVVHAALRGVDAVVHLAAIVGELLVIVFFLLDRYNIIGLGFLWLNVLGTLAVVALAYLFSFLTKR